MNISVVIPSLGGDLCEILDSINSSSVYPDEVIVCLPNHSHFVKNANRYENLTVIYAERYGQVYQRIVGFHQARGDYIFQANLKVCYILLLFQIFSFFHMIINIKY